jgi:hypothetical protein
VLSALPYLFFLVLGLARNLTAQSSGPVLHRDDFAGDLSQWMVEQQPGGTVWIRDGALEIDDAAGCTVWFKAKLTAPVIISCEVTFVTAGGPNDRRSDLNGFWMASDPRSPADLFAAGHGRNGLFATYDSLRTYDVGQDGNTNTTTRFRRYDGTGARPLLPEHERTGAEDLLAPPRAPPAKSVSRRDPTAPSATAPMGACSFNELTHNRLMRDGSAFAR